MPRFLTEAWAEALNAALDGASLPQPGPDAGLAAADGSFSVAQEVHGGPDGDVCLLLTAEAGTARLAVAPLDATPATPVDVTIVLAYEVAVALATGVLTPAEALTDGHVRVRGDLSVLVAGQALLVAARALTRVVDADTTY